MINILGIMGWASHDPAAAIIQISDQHGLRYCTIAEERLSRVKYSYYFPLRSIKFCMDHLGIKNLGEIDLLVCDWSQDFRTLDTNRSFRKLEYDYIRQNLNIDRSKIRVIPSHHLGHAHSCYMPCPFNDAAILVVDAIGSGLKGTSLFEADGVQIKLLEASGSYSLGKLYDSVTRKILNFSVGEDGKTMGLAAFGSAREKQNRVLGIQPSVDGLQIDLSKFMRRMPDNRLIGSYVPCPSTEALYSSDYADVAYEVQEVTEKLMIDLVVHAKRKTNSKNLCITGGVGLNCVANEKIIRSKIFENVWIQPACSDAGLPMGLAYYGLSEISPAKSKTLSYHVFNNRTYANDEITEMLEGYEVPYLPTSTIEVAELIAKKNVIGWFCLGSEQGPRALGHRSILADPSYPDMKDILNIKVKHREPYRPFAPAVLAQYASEYFEFGDENDLASQFMLRAPNVRLEKESEICAVVHVDKTARVQTVKEQDNPLFFQLLTDFKNVTGVPVLVNTSFNDNNEPIVETPEDALICFLRTNIDYLVFEGKYLIKNEPSLKQKLSDIVAKRQKRLKNEYKLLIKRFLKNYAPKQMRLFARREAAMADYYRSYEALGKLREMMVNSKKLQFIGDEYHLNLCNSLLERQIIPLEIEVIQVAEDIISSIPVITKDIDTKNKTIIGFYNISELLKERLEGPHLFLSTKIFRLICKTSFRSHK